MVVASISTLFTLYAKDIHLYQNFIGRDASNLAKPYTVMGSSVGCRGCLPSGLPQRVSSRGALMSNTGILKPTWPLIQRFAWIPDPKLNLVRKEWCKKHQYAKYNLINWCNNAKITCCTPLRNRARSITGYIPCHPPLGCRCCAPAYIANFWYVSWSTIKYFSFSTQKYLKKKTF